MFIWIGEGNVILLFTDGSRNCSYLWHMRQLQHYERSKSANGGPTSHDRLKLPHHSFTRFLLNLLMEHRSSQLHGVRVLGFTICMHDHPASSNARVSPRGTAAASSLSIANTEQIIVEACVSPARYLCSRTAGMEALCVFERVVVEEEGRGKEESCNGYHRAQLPNSCARLDGTAIQPTEALFNSYSFLQRTKCNEDSI